ncbi:hypothetical protein ACT3TB_08910 [Micrococcaceae sp. AOP34-BR2-30]
MSAHESAADGGAPAWWINFVGPHELLGGVSIIFRSDDETQRAFDELNTDGAPIPTRFKML